MSEGNNTAGVACDTLSKERAKLLARIEIYRKLLARIEIYRNEADGYERQLSMTRSYVAELQAQADALASAIQKLGG